MNLPDFQNEALAQVSVSKYTPAGNPWKDGGFLGQCVSLINQYCYRVLDVPAGAWGNAKDWPTNPSALSFFDKVSTPQTGDIGVMGANYGGGYGHIFIYLSPSQILEQNGSKPLAVSVRSPYPSPIAILRKKGASPGGNVDEIAHRDQIIKDQEAALAEKDAKIAELTSTLNITIKQETTYEGIIAQLKAHTSDDADKKIDAIKQILGV